MADPTPDPDPAPTPEPAPDPAPAPAPAPPKEGDGLSEVKETLAAVVSTMQSLVEVVSKNVSRDDAPKSRPWTHLGNR